MKTLITLVVSVLFAAPVLSADTNWVLEKSEIIYHADHTFHNTRGTTEAAKGKGVCNPGGCDFLVAVPVKTFDSGDQNRDLHMIQAVNGGDYPMVSVRTHTTDLPKAPKMTADLTVDFGGKQVVYKNVSFEVSDQTADSFHIKGTIPLVLSRHNVKLPSLLGVAVKDEAPTEVDVKWKKAG